LGNYSLENADNKHLTCITETLTSFENILYATTMELWDTNLKKPHQLKASQKCSARIEEDKFSSVTTTTAKAIDKALSSIHHQNNSLKKSLINYRVKKT